MDKKVLTNANDKTKESPYSTMTSSQHDGAVKRDEADETAVSDEPISAVSVRTDLSDKDEKAKPGSYWNDTATRSADKESRDIT
jgi:hypothetical protein